MSENPERPYDESPSAPAPGTLTARAKIAIVTVVVLGLVGGIALRGTDLFAPAVSGGSVAPAGADPVAAFEDALAAGLPVYLFFHSGGCPSCLELQRISVQLQPEYDGVITFVDASTADPRSQQLRSQFPFQYVPALFFLAADGSIIDQTTGGLTEESLRTRLDSLADAARAGGGS